MCVCVNCKQNHPLIDDVCAREGVCVFVHVYIVYVAEARHARRERWPHAAAQVN